MDCKAVAAQFPPAPISVEAVIVAASEDANMTEAKNVTTENIAADIEKARQKEAEFVELIAGWIVDAVASPDFPNSPNNPIPSKWAQLAIKLINEFEGKLRKRAVKMKKELEELDDCLFFLEMIKEYPKEF
ncbi:MAG: hypothetical protein ACYCXG_00255 [Acidiferrobacter sp.]